MKNHLKRIASPRTWVIDRKFNTFITKPHPGAHRLDQSLSLGVILRDELKFAFTMSEAKKLLNNNEVLVDGKRRKDHQHMVGLFDVLSFPSIKEHFRLVLNEKGKLVIIKISETESKIKLCKVVGKAAVKKGKIQYHLHDGKNIISGDQINIGDTLVLSLPACAIQTILSLKPGSFIFLAKGKHVGSCGKLKEIKGDDITYTKEDQEIETAKKYLFVIGNHEPLIQLS